MPFEFYKCDAHCTVLYVLTVQESAQVQDSQVRLLPSTSIDCGIMKFA